ncbi:MAG: TerB family tellurite resistance protein [Gammaproteobacteria bacterium]|nr:TerB family tellurite resistance protein [Gammaproteobacteria bacterium]MDH3372806.1 TerB family tellurite resistance protein [Gammaproteobacteria bacterium]MDH3408705.1 TerB family tellurite resistance protein [Gammaproteobacteria bacterium]MDH3551954.1 TerB family tellurite resistance protein [Gammaproteobacteria bacterium]
MAIADLKRVLKIFGGSDVNEGEREELYKEVLLMTLARAADADINIQNVEVDRIREILKEHTGDDFSASDIRVAARAELYAEASLRKYLASVRSKLADKYRVDTVRALADVFRSDKNVSVLEIDFFNGVVEALQVSPAEVAGLSAGDVD